MEAMAGDAKFIHAHTRMCVHEYVCSFFLYFFIFSAVQLILLIFGPKNNLSTTMDIANGLYVKITLNKI